MIFLAGQRTAGSSHSAGQEIAEAREEGEKVSSPFEVRFLFWFETPAAYFSFSLNFMRVFGNESVFLESS